MAKIEMNHVRKFRSRVTRNLTSGEMLLKNSLKNCALPNRWEVVCEGHVDFHAVPGCIVLEGQVTGHHAPSWLGRYLLQFLGAFSVSGVCSNLSGLILAGILPYHNMKLSARNALVRVIKFVLVHVQCYNGGIQVISSSEISVP